MPSSSMYSDNKQTCPFQWCQNRNVYQCCPELCAYMTLDRSSLNSATNISQHCSTYNKYKTDAKKCKHSQLISYLCFACVCVCEYECVCFIKRKCPCYIPEAQRENTVALPRHRQNCCWLVSCVDQWTIRYTWSKFACICWEDLPQDVRCRPSVSNANNLNVSLRN